MAQVDEATLAALRSAAAQRAFAVFLLYLLRPKLLAAAQLDAWLLGWWRRGGAKAALRAALAQLVGELLALFHSATFRRL